METGTIVARMRVVTNTATEELTLAAGTDTSEWAHERPDVRASIKHALAPVFDSVPGDDDNSFRANRYWTTLPLSSPRLIERIEIENVSSTAFIAIWKAVIHDRVRQFTMPLNTDSELFSSIQDHTRWERPLSQDSVLILKNLRSRGRAWLVSKAEAVDAEQALHRVRGEASDSFDPFQLALLEVPPGDLPVLDAGVPPGEVKQLTYKPNAIEIVTESDGRSLLVVSESNYPGWVALVDGNPATLYKTDYVLQGVAVPAGRHVIELRYTAPAARKGAIISILSVVLLAGLAVAARRRSGQQLVNSSVRI